MLAIYVAWWIRKRRGFGFAFPLYVLLTVAMMVAAIQGFSPHNAQFVDLFLTGLFVGWILTGFVLRSELRSFYGKELQVNVVLTVFFSVLYLDYCLWAIGDGV